MGTSVENGRAPAAGTPDPAVLERAWEEARELFGPSLGHVPAWHLEPALRRRKSVVVPLRARLTRGGELRAFYKTYLPRSAPGSPERAILDGAFNRMARLSRRFDERSAGRPIAGARVLDVDTDRLTIVTLGLPGRPLGAAWRHRLPGRRGNARARYRLVGEASSLIESCSDPHMPSTDAFLTRKAEASVRRGRVFFQGEERKAFQDTVERLRSEAAGEHPRAIYAHNDLSQTNILCDGMSIGLIDFGWRVAVPSYDLACFLVRLSYETPRPAPWTADLVDEVLAGYGDANLRASPAFRFSLLHRLVAMAAASASSTKHASRGARALDSIRDLMSGGDGDA